MMKQLGKMVSEWLRSLGFAAYEGNDYANWFMFICWVVVAYFLFYGIYRLILFFMKKFLNKKKEGFHKALINRKLYRWILYIPNLIVARSLIWVLFKPQPKVPMSDMAQFVLVILQMCTVVVTAMIFISVVNAFNDVYSKKQGSIKSIVQAAKTVIYILAAIFIICILIGIPIKDLMVSLAGASAIMMLVFKDSILGLVAGIQLTANRMVLPGDWIEMPSADADGNVTEISLVAVKVQNWDNTITTVPAYDLITKPVKNWRGMSTSGVRRIKRSIFLDMTSVHFCTKEMLDKFRKIEYLDEYISRKEKEIAEHNNAITFDKEVEVNGRHLTNLGIFRIYLQRYLENHPMLSHDFTLMARQLQPTNLGIPIEIYGFAKTTNWFEYEKIQSDIFDHVISAISHFDLLIFQNPSWNDYRKRH
ncbi:MAG: mechanosensitive ion channel family protein [Bacteroidales bacterium]|nr:mechanosensitive ion channel family protein [Bacteroidales bacterium]